MFQKTCWGWLLLNCNSKNSFVWRSLFLSIRSLFRGAGALLGVLGVVAHPVLARAFGRMADALSATCLASFTLVAVASFWCLAPFATRDSGRGIGAAMSAFMLAVCFARPGLYAFELGILNRSQELADARHRSAIGTVDAALTSVGTLVPYSSGLILHRPEEFYILVSCSAFFVCLGAVTYWMWMLLFRYLSDTGIRFRVPRKTTGTHCSKKRRLKMAGTNIFTINLHHFALCNDAEELVFCVSPCL